uniref:Uncharacterized protein n=1 Tax=Triticum urartu TaxID=4572 RepID=A0A8R7RCM9_TRIUA
TILHTPVSLSPREHEPSRPPGARVPSAATPHPSAPSNPLHPLPSPVVVVAPRRRSISKTEPRPTAPWSTPPAGGCPDSARPRRRLTSPPWRLPQDLRHRLALLCARMSTPLPGPPGGQPPAHTVPVLALSATMVE